MSDPKGLIKMSEQELLRLYGELLEELRDRKLVRSSNNPVADYAEKIAVELMGLTRADKEERGYDALDSRGIKYEIKGRRITRHNNSRQLGVIRNLDKELFNYLIAVVFNDDFSVKEMWKVPYSFVKENAKFSKHVEGHIFIAKYKLLSEHTAVERMQ